MTHDRMHLEWDELNDLVDGRMGATERARTERHLLACADCSARRAELVALLAAASAVPDTLTPPAELWDDIRADIAAPARGGASITRVRGDDVVARIAPRAAPATGPSRRWLAAAAVALVVTSSGITAIWMRATSNGGASVAERETPAARGDSITRVGASGVALPASLARAEAAYRSDAEALRALFERERQSLSPATIAVVERSLATIDAAIAEARAALIADPSNAELARFLDSSYRQKVELLRRVTSLEVRT